MKYKIKIQSNRSFNLPRVIKDEIKSKGFDKAEWIIDNNNKIVKLNFLKDIETPLDKTEDDIMKFYRNIYRFSMIKIPNIIYNYLNCEIFDNIILDIDENDVVVTSSKKERISELSALIKE